MSGFACAQCNAEVRSDGKSLTRTCDHVTAPIIVQMSAVVYGQAHVDAGHPEALKLMDTTPAPEG